MVDFYLVPRGTVYVIIWPYNNNAHPVITTACRPHNCNELGTPHSISRKSSYMALLWDGFM